MRSTVETVLHVPKSGADFQFHAGCGDNVPRVCPRRQLRQDHASVFSFDHAVFRDDHIYAAAPCERQAAFFDQLADAVLVKEPGGHEDFFCA